MRLQTKPRGKPVKRLPTTIDVDETAPVSSIHERISARTGLSVHRIRLTKGSDGTVIPHSNKDTVSDTGLLQDSVILVKDLGPQIAWRTVFVIEYLGPLLIHPIILYLLRPYLYPYYTGAISTSTISPLQTLIAYMSIFHFIKREVETLFIHRFSAQTMPFLYIFRNSAHYWLLAGLIMAWDFYRPDAAITSPTHYANNAIYKSIFVTLFVFAEAANANAHLTLANLRPKGTTKRGIPKGFGFATVTCPNYGFEILAWLCVWALSGFSWACILYLTTGSYFMWMWGKKKERRYRKEFGTLYKAKRSVMIPGLL